MVQEAPKEHGAVLAFCTYCGNAYLASDVVTASECHATPPQLVYDLEDHADASSVVAALLEQLAPPDPETLLRYVKALAELVRDKVAGATDELSQEPSTAAGPETLASEQVGPMANPDASVEGPPKPPAPPVLPANSDAGETPAGAPAATSRRRSGSSRSRTKTPAVVS